MHFTRYPLQAIVLFLLLCAGCLDGGITEQGDALAEAASEAPQTQGTYAAAGDLLMSIAGSGSSGFDAAAVIDGPEDCPRGTRYLERPGNDRCISCAMVVRGSRCNTWVDDSTRSTCICEDCPALNCGPNRTPDEEACRCNRNCRPGGPQGPGDCAPGETFVPRTCDCLRYCSANTCPTATGGQICCNSACDAEGNGCSGCPADDECCNSDDPCCGSDDPCCGTRDACCGSDDPCCGSDDPCCGIDDCEPCGDSVCLNGKECVAYDFGGINYGSCSYDQIGQPCPCSDEYDFCLCKADSYCYRFRYRCL